MASPTQSSNFQIILTIVFVVFAVVAVLMFAGIIKVGTPTTGTASATGTVVLWGTLPKNTVNKVFSDFNQANKTFTVNYIEKSPDTIDGDLVEALSAGVGPDLVFMPNDKIIKYRNKVIPIPFTSLPEATFRDTYVDEAKLYIDPQGTLGFPILIDPMVMYYNLDMLQSAGIARPPQTWDDVASDVTLLTVRDNTTNAIKKSTVALGSFDNISYAKDILSLLMLQTGNPITSRSNDGTLVSTLKSSTGSDALSNPIQSALKFYESFADPANPSYSWNRSRPDSRSAFIQGDLALYFGYASDLFSIQSQNPNLNFDVAMIPQRKDASTKVTFGKIMSVAVMKSSKNLNTAFIAGNLLSGADFTGKLTALPSISLPPVRRDLLSIAPPQSANQSYVSTFYKSALIARAWLDPDTNTTSNIFRSMVEDTFSGKLTYQGAVDEASSTLDLLLAQVQALQVPAQ